MSVLPAAAEVALKKRPLVQIQAAYSTGALSKADDAQWALLASPCSKQLKANVSFKKSFVVLSWNIKFANMSHELRTPLNGIIGFAEFLADSKAGGVNPKRKELLEDILNSGKHLLQLISDILDMTKVLTGKMELHPESFSL